MDEYICKNSVREKPCSVRLYEFNLEWQCGERKGTIPYANIISLSLNKVGSKFIARIESDYQGSITLTNRFYLGNGEFEDRSRHYNTFIRLLHFHLSKQTTTAFYCGIPLRNLVVVFCCAFVSLITIQLAITYLLNETNLWLSMGNILFFLIILFICLKSFPRAYPGDNIPINYLPGIQNA
jgi:hypothetical protein